MCELCSETQAVRESGQGELRCRAEMFRHFARELEAIASGHFSPHGDRAAKMREHALSLARYLMQEWV